MHRSKLFDDFVADIWVLADDYIRLLWIAFPRLHLQVLRHAYTIVADKIVGKLYLLRVYLPSRACDALHEFSDSLNIGREALGTNV